MSPPKTLEDVASLITERHVKRIVLMTGAGVSTSAGIPDFRSPKTGLYANLKSYNLPFPEAVFELTYFRAHPEAFFRLAKELYPGHYAPTLAHYFFALLEDKGLLLRCYSQNIDCLDVQAGLSPDKLVEAHGSFATATCLRCKNKSSVDDVRPLIAQQAIVRCQKPGCKGRKDALVKPDIVFFGEGLPARFHQLSRSDFRKADLLIVLGTSLQVHPFAGLVDACACPKVLVNLEAVPQMSRFDVVCLQKADDAMLELAEHLGWRHELELLQKAGNELLQARRGASTSPEAPDRPKSPTTNAKQTSEKVASALKDSREEDVDALTAAVDNIEINKADASSRGTDAAETADTSKASL